MKGWTEEKLAGLPAKNDVRLRGLEMTRLETFTDAAFAFATTLLVISLGGIPESYAGLLVALKGTPAFAASFAAVASFWASHRTWSRRYGLEDGPSIMISLALIFVMLVYVYPLKMVFSALFYWISRGWLPTSFTFSASDGELNGLFVIYGAGFFAMALMMSLLYRRAVRCADELRLDAVELLRAREEMVSFAAMAGTAMVSALFAWLMPLQVGVWAGFIYCALPVILPLVSVRYSRQVARLKAELVAEPEGVDEE